MYSVKPYFPQLEVLTIFDTYIFDILKTLQQRNKFFIITRKSGYQYRIMAAEAMIFDL